MSKTYPTYISKEEINELPGIDCFGRFMVVETREQEARAIQELKGATELGFDTETRPSFSKGEVYQVAMLQLATNKCAYLFRLNIMPLTPGLIEILSNPNIVKAGVAIADDVKTLQKIEHFTPAGFVDLSTEVKKLGFTSVGLRALTAIYLGKRLSKAAKVTNWEKSPLTEAQLKYAANDAFAGLMIYQEMKTKAAE